MTRLWQRIGIAACCAGLMGCGTPRVSTIDPAIRRDAESARAAYESGQPEKAAKLYERAMARASLVDSPDEAGRNAYNLALCQIRMGQPDEARKWLRQATLLFGKPGPDMAKVLVAEAEAARLQGQSAEVAKLADAALKNTAEAIDRVQAHLLLAELAISRGDLDAGQVHYRKANRLAVDKASPSIRARLEAVAARLIQAGVMEGNAAACLERRAHQLKGAGDYQGMAESLKAAGEAYAVAGKPAHAFELLIRAASSLKAAGDDTQALKTAEQVGRLAGEIGDRAGRDRAAILIEGMKQ
jgi:tetratricopeptide (TPR) repeat protein